MTAGQRMFLTRKEFHDCERFILKTADDRGAIAQLPDLGSHSKLKASSPFILSNPRPREVRNEAV